MGFSKKLQESPNFDFAKSLMVFETEPFKSNLDIYYETSTSGLISELNNDIANGIDPTGEGVIGDIDGVSVTSWRETTPANSIITNEFTAQDLNGNTLGGTSSQFLTIEITNVVTSNNIAVPNPPFECVQSQPPSLPTTPPTFNIKLLPAGVQVYDANSNVDDSYFVTLTATVNEPNAAIQTLNKTINLALTNVEPSIYRIQGFASQNSLSGFNGMPIGSYYERVDILNDYLRANMGGANGYPPIATQGPDRPNQLQTSYYAQRMKCGFLKVAEPWNSSTSNGKDVGYISHFTNGFDFITGGAQATTPAPGYPGDIDNDAFYYDSSSTLPTSDQIAQEMFPGSRRDLQAVIHKVVKYNSYWEGGNSQQFGTPPPQYFATFVPRGWYNGGVNDPKAQIGYGGDLNARRADAEFQFVNSGNVQRSIYNSTGTSASPKISKDVMLLQYVGPNGTTFNDRWHGSYSGNRAWWAAWYYQIQIKIKDAGGATGSLSSETYYMNFLVGNNSKHPKN